MRDKPLQHDSGHTPVRDAYSLPKVDDELHSKTIFEPVSVEARPAKAKSRIRNKLRWKEGYEPHEKSEDAKSTDNSEHAIQLHLLSAKEPSVDSERISAVKGKINSDKREKTDKGNKEKTADERSGRIANEKPNKTIAEWPTTASVAWLVTRKILEEVLISLIVIVIVIASKIHH
ncbi:unnamed protein product [Thelazia callipaeda]|uniref:Transmembrane protein n=1 Tax=Thelazia callipaeda TaxID=103827 RepID=A0A0N5DBK4_THECL|nr:unnamed protein product [Thelazia callipaeda]